MLAVLAGRDIPAAGAGGAGARPGGSIPRLPAAAAGRAPHRWKKRHLAPRPHPLRPRPRETPAPTGQMCPQLERPPAVPSRAGVGDGRALPRPGGSRPGQGPAGPGRGAGHRGPLAGVSLWRGDAWRQQEQEEQPRCALASTACLQHLATGLAAQVQTLSLSKLTRAAGTAKGIKKAAYKHLLQAQRREKMHKMHFKVSGLSPERADTLLHPAIAQEAFYPGWVPIAATLPYRPEQVSLPCLSSPCFAGYLRKLCRLCTEVDGISIFRFQGYFCT